MYFILAAQLISMSNSLPHVRVVYFGHEIVFLYVVY